MPDDPEIHVCDYNHTVTLTWVEDQKSGIGWAVYTCNDCDYKWEGR